MKRDGGGGAEHDVNIFLKHFLLADARKQHIIPN